ncbi:MAG: hypothetical protein WCJ30_24375 [Deltaproteobacteria bacterium]
MPTHARPALAFLLLAALHLAGCDTGVVLRSDGGDARDTSRSDTTDVTDVTDVPDATDATTPLDVSADVAPTDVPGTDAPPVDTGAGTDDATLVSDSFPHALGCTAQTTVTATVLNSGTSTWTDAAGFALVAVGGTDPFVTSDPRVRLAAGESVAPGAMHDFVIPMRSTGAAGTSHTDWRLEHAGVAFGPVAEADVLVSCDTVVASDFRLADVTIVSSPDVRPFVVTSDLTSLTFAPGTIHVDHTLRGTWPPVVIDPDGTTQEATIWVFFHIAGTWYATGGERLRPTQPDKELSNPSAIGPGWLYDPGRWGIMTGYVPSPGDLVGFMVVAGSTRSDNHVIVQERTGVVLVPFPSDGVTTSFPPFAYHE